MTKLTGEKGDYELSAQLGIGGNGVVWRASGPDGEVAIKVLKKARNAPSDAGPRFDREIQALRLLEDVRGVLPLLDSRQSDRNAELPWFAMPIATPLREKLTSESTLTDVCCAFADLAGTLAVIHERGAVHRDIKPENLYWHEDVWCLGDFGLADFQGAEPLTANEKKLGPVHYIAPEMLNSALSADGKAADVYSLAKALWVIASGQNYPLPGVHDPSVAGAEIGAYRSDKRTALLDELLRRMTLQEPTRRPKAAEVASELRLLCVERATGMASTPDEAMAKLRAALVKHFVHKDDEARQRILAEEAISRIRSAMTAIARGIENQTELNASSWHDIPTYWGFRAHLGSARVTWSTEDGFSFEAGGVSFKWRLSLGWKGQLLSDGRLFVGVGYQFDQLVNGNITNELGVNRGWKYSESAPNGNPSCDAMINNVIDAMQKQLPMTLEMFAERVAAASRR